ncbi:MAG: RecX family transcriptional regulator [Bacteroidetes bacterium]|nr:RecX family transcriptional regulator [Bacteroidota bacterium]MCY4204791.1 RecX family transcriptional regulator [Bacteroidota bacterium]
MSRDKSNSPVPGKITELKQQVERRDRVSVFIDGEFSFGVWANLVVENQLYVGKKLNEIELSSLLDGEEVSQIRSVALQYLAYAPRTEQQLYERLHLKGYSKYKIEYIIEDLRDLGYIDDRQYAMEYAKARFDHKGYGPRRIHRELAADGVQNEYIVEAISACLNLNDLAERGKQLIERFQGRVQGTFSERKKKLIAYLTRRGYEYMMAKELVQEVLSQSEHSESSK